MDVAEAAYAMGLVCDAEERYLDALKHYDEALSIRRFALGDTHLDVATTHHAIALASRGHPSCAKRQGEAPVLFL